MPHHKKRKPPNARAACNLCKPWKRSGGDAQTLHELRARISEREQLQELADVHICGCWGFGCHLYVEDLCEGSHSWGPHERREGHVRCSACLVVRERVVRITYEVPMRGA